MVKFKLHGVATTVLVLWSLLGVVCSQELDPTEATVPSPETPSTSPLSTLLHSEISLSTLPHSEISLPPATSKLETSSPLPALPHSKISLATLPHSEISLPPSTPELETSTTLQSPLGPNTVTPFNPDAPIPTPQESLEVFYNLTKEYFNWKLKEFPQWTTSLGINDETAGRLDSFDPQRFEKRREDCRQFFLRATAGLQLNDFTEADMLNYGGFVDELLTFLENFKYLKFFAPVNFMGGPQNSLKYLLKFTVLKSYDDYQKLLSRYSEFSRQSIEVINLMKDNIGSGLMPSNWSLKGVPKQIDDLLLPYNETIFYKPFIDIKINITEEQKDRLQQMAEEPVKQLLAGFKNLRDFIVAEYLPVTRPVEGVSSLPGGEDYYKACLKYHISSDLSPQQVHDLGLSEVTRIQEEVAQTGAELGLANMTLAEINKGVQEDPNQKFESKEDLLDTYRKAVYQDIYPLMDQIVNKVPDVNVSIEENVAGEGYASYFSAPIDGSRPGTFFINAKIYQHHKRYEVNALSLHEALPGHHLQSVTLQMNPKIPDFRKYPAFDRYEDIPAKFPMNTAYAEGWGLYSEYLGNELGLYKDPYQRLGRHSFELLRAARLVVDTGIHALGWTRQKAIDYLSENTAMTKKAVENEIDRYITWPGQACAYKVGEIKIKELRERAEVALGDLFKVQDFHDTVLGCYGSLTDLEKCVDRYISASKPPAPASSLPAPASSLPAPASSLRAPASSLPAPESSFPSTQQSIEAFYNLTKEYFSWKLKEFPQQTSYLGINDETAGHLDSFNPEHFEKRKEDCRQFLIRATRDLSNRDFSEEDLLNYRSFIEELISYIENFKYLKFFAPVNFMGGPQNDLQYTFKYTVLKTYNDYLKLLSRYSEFPRQSQEIINLMKGNIQSGLMPSNWSMKGVPQQIDKLLLPYKESVFYKPFIDIKINITEEQKGNLRRIAEKPVKQILEGFKSIRDFIVAKYLPVTRPVEGVSSLPDGLNYYKACLKYHTSTDLTPQEIHDLGISEISRIQREVVETGEELGLVNMTLADINKVVKEDPSQKFLSKEDLLSTYRKAVYQDIYPLMDQIVNKVPEVNVSVEENVAGEGYASYSSAPIDGSRPGTFFINAEIYPHHKRYEVTALSLHEAVPGHHLQFVNLQTNPKVPNFMKYPDYYRYEDIPAKFPTHTAYVEGWGLYSEYLGNELGLYKDPYQRLGRHSFELLRAARLVVDTGIHALGWTRQQAIEYLLENTFLTKKAIENQIDRYITWPGQACAYKVGEIKIKELRERAEVALGNLFKLQDFHDTVLGCIGTLKNLEKCVERYINRILN